MEAMEDYSPPRDDSGRPLRQDRTLSPTTSRTVSMTPSTDALDLTPFDSLSALALDEFAQERHAFIRLVRNEAFQEAAVLCGASGEPGMAAAIRGLQRKESPA